MANSYKQNKENKDRRINRINFLETTIEVKQWLAWISLPEYEKNKIKTEWNQYYKDVLKTKPYFRYLEMVKACDTDNKQRIKELKLEARESWQANNYDLKEPNQANGDELVNNYKVIQYMDLKTKLKYQDVEYGEAASIFN